MKAIRPLNVKSSRMVKVKLPFVGGIELVFALEGVVRQRYRLDSLQSKDICCLLSHRLSVIFAVKSSFSVSLVS